MNQLEERILQIDQLKNTSKRLQHRVDRVPISYKRMHNENYPITFTCIFIREIQLDNFFLYTFMRLCNLYGYTLTERCSTECIH